MGLEAVHQMMANATPENERINLRYLQFLKDAKGRDEPSLDAGCKGNCPVEEQSRAAISESFILSRRVLQDADGVQERV